jgi:predicted phosphodiesterase
MRIHSFLLVVLSCLLSCSGEKPVPFVSVSEAREGVIERILQQTPVSYLDSIDSDFVMQFITPEEKQIFADNYWVFTIDRPAVVSVMRHKEQETIPFWLPEKGFVNTGRTVRSERYEYEVWQKHFPAGTVRLGINGFDRHREVYFVTVGADDEEKEIRVTEIHPSGYPQMKMRPGAYTYTDWEDMQIEELPAEIAGHTLLATVRGRAREASIAKCFRTTEYPSSQTPDQIVLTWSDDPATTQTLHWRTDTTVTESCVSYCKPDVGDNGTEEKPASFVTLKDACIRNDRAVRYWGVTLTGLIPNTKYTYRILNRAQNTSSEVRTFKTAPAEAAPFRFIYLGDTHNDALLRPVMEQAYRACPDAAFFVHTGDHVNTGLERDLWDKYLHLGRDMFSRLAILPAIGNHDSQHGLPPSLYTQVFRLPEDTTGRCRLPAGRNYTLAYAGVRFFSLDATGNADSIACWLEEQLEKATEKWKIVLTHFPPYYADDSFPDLREKWCTLFDKYHVDLVLSGHIHQYFRSRPLFAGRVVDSPANGTIYISSIVATTRHRPVPSPRYNIVSADRRELFQILSVDAGKLEYLSQASDGTVIDRFDILKP